MESILDDIRDLFASTSRGARKIKSLPKEYPAWVIKMDDGYGVCVEYDRDDIVSERFANVYMRVRRISISEKEYNLLTLTCIHDYLRNEFATLCYQFVNPGTNGKMRNELITTPENWWERWKNLMGNQISDMNSYDIIAEMVILEKLKRDGVEPIWRGIMGNTHDIESNNACYEIKSTLTKYKSEITISNQFQLDSKKDLYLYFLRMEESNFGYSINDMVDRLCSIGFDKNSIESQLTISGFENGRSIRNKKYRIIEKRKYKINDNFPKITNESFKDNKFPKSIVKINYTIDLDGIEYQAW